MSSSAFQPMRTSEQKRTVGTQEAKSFITTAKLNFHLSVVLEYYETEVSLSCSTHVGAGFYL